MLSDFVGARSSYISIEAVGIGASSTVILAKDPKDSNSPFAVKRFHPHINQIVFMPEIETLVRLNHPCILRILNYSLPTKSSPAEIHMEWAEHGSLARVLTLVQCGQFPSFWNPTGIAIIVTGIVLGMRYMHSRCFIHQDLNPSNILVNSDGRALIGDFGSSRSESDNITPRASQNDEYTDPEICYYDDWSSKVDVYSFGLILYEVVVGSPVFRPNDPPDEIVEKKMTSFLPSIPSEVPPSMVRLIHACLAFDPSIRPSFDDILTMLEEIYSSVLPDAGWETFREYVKAVTDWELTHHRHSSLRNPAISPSVPIDDFKLKSYLLTLINALL
jgi:serine/threonine protein kinase